MVFVCRAPHLSGWASRKVAFSVRSLAVLSGMSVWWWGHIETTILSSRSPAQKNTGRIQPESARFTLVVDERNVCGFGRRTARDSRCPFGEAARGVEDERRRRGC